MAKPFRCRMHPRQIIQPTANMAATLSSSLVFLFAVLQRICLKIPSSGEGDAFHSNKTLSFLYSCSVDCNISSCVIQKFMDGLLEAAFFTFRKKTEHQKWRTSVVTLLNQSWQNTNITQKLNFFHYPVKVLVLCLFQCHCKLIF